MTGDLSKEGKVLKAMFGLLDVVGTEEKALRHFSCRRAKHRALQHLDIAQKSKMILMRMGFEPMPFRTSEIRNCTLS